MEQSFPKHYLEDAIESFRAYKKLADKALDQITDKEFFDALDEEANSIAVIMKHMAGNMFSRWTDFLTTDGEKPARNRDMEFVVEPETKREEVFDYWEKGWDRVFSALRSLKPEDFDRKVLISGEEHSIVQAINRQLTHYAYHIGQIVFLAKHFRSPEWKSLSIPKNKSVEFNKYLEERERESGTSHRFDAAAKFLEYPGRK
jgi:uncharacterized protein DUF1572